MGYVLSYDVGTSTLKAVLLNRTGHIEAMASATYPVHRPAEGYAEQSPTDWWSAVVKTTREVMDKSGVPADEVAAMVFVTQAIGIVPISKLDGNPLCPAIIWLDSRAGAEAEELTQIIAAAMGAEDMSIGLTGKDVLPKLMWLSRNREELWEQMDCFLDVNGYLIYRCTGEKVYDYASASCICYESETDSMNADLLGVAGFDPARFPRFVRAEELVGTLTEKAADALKLPRSVKVFGGSNDTQAAALGSGMSSPGEAHYYMGSSGWAIVVSDDFSPLSSGGASIMAAEYGKALRFYQPETACTAFNWCIDELFGYEKEQMGEDVYKFIEETVAAVPAGSNYLLFGPWMQGERCPVSDIYVRGSFLNLGLSHKRQHMLRAVMEGILYNLRWANEGLEKDIGYAIPTLRVLGGGTQSPVWMQMMADIFNRPVEVIRHTQAAGAVGGAFLAALGLGEFKDFSEVKRWVEVEATYFPKRENVAVYEEIYQYFKESYGSVKDLYRAINYKRMREPV